MLRSDDELEVDYAMFTLGSKMKFGELKRSIHRQKQ